MHLIDVSFHLSGRAVFFLIFFFFVATFFVFPFRFYAREEKEQTCLSIIFGAFALWFHASFCFVFSWVFPVRCWWTIIVIRRECLCLIFSPVVFLMIVVKMFVCLFVSHFPSFRIYTTFIFHLPSCLLHAKTKYFILILLFSSSNVNFGSHLFGAEPHFWFFRWNMFFFFFLFVPRMLLTQFSLSYGNERLQFAILLVCHFVCFISFFFIIIISGCLYGTNGAFNFPKLNFLSTQFPFAYSFHMNMSIFGRLNVWNQLEQ